MSSSGGALVSRGWHEGLEIGTSVGKRMKADGGNEDL